MLKAILAAINLFIGVLLVILSAAWLRISPLISILLLIAAFDQFEDVYYLSTGKSIFPKILSGLDVGAELVQFILSIAIIFFGLSYIGKIEYAFLPYLTVALGLMIAFSSAYDIASLPSRYALKPRMEVLSIEAGLERTRRRRVIRKAV